MRTRNVGSLVFFGLGFLGLGFLATACGHQSQVSAPLAMVPAPALADNGADDIDYEVLGRGDPLYRSGSRLKIRWVEAVGQTAAKIPIAIFDSKLKTDCKINYQQTELRTCVPVGTEVDDEKVAFLAENEKSPALIVADSECNGPQSHTADDDHLWSLGPMLGDMSEDLPDPKSGQIHVKRYVLDPPKRTDDSWTLEGPGCVVRAKKNVRGPFCVRAFHEVDLHDDAQVREVVLGTPGDPMKAGGTIVMLGSDGSVLPMPTGPEFYDAKNDLRCSMREDNVTCLPAPWDQIQAAPVVGQTATVVNYMGHDYSEWGNFKTGPTKDAQRIWARLSPADPNGGNTQQRNVLSLLDMSAVLSFPMQVDGIDRVAEHVRHLPDRRDVPISLFDTASKRDCEPKQTASGAWRCVVAMPLWCKVEGVVDGGVEKEAVTGGADFGECSKDGSCCKGGTLFIPARAGRPPRRFGMNSGYARPATPQRVVRFSDVGRPGDRSQLIYDKISESTEDAFPLLRIAQDE